MIPPCVTVTPMVSWPMPQRMPIPVLRWAQSAPGSEANADSNLTPTISRRSGQSLHFRIGSAYPPEPTQSPFTHRPKRAARGFLHWRISYASARNPSQDASFNGRAFNDSFCQSLPLGWREAV